MLSGKATPENAEKQQSDQLAKKSNFARAAHFFCTFFAIVLHHYNVKLPETS